MDTDRKVTSASARGDTTSGTTSAPSSSAVTGAASDTRGGDRRASRSKRKRVSGPGCLRGTRGGKRRVVSSRSPASGACKCCAVVNKAAISISRVYSLCGDRKYACPSRRLDNNKTSSVSAFYGVVMRRTGTRGMHNRMIFTRTVLRAK